MGVILEKFSDEKELFETAGDIKTAKTARNIGNRGRRLWLHGKKMQ